MRIYFDKNKFLRDNNKKTTKRNSKQNLLINSSVFIDKICILRRENKNGCCLIQKKNHERKSINKLVTF